MNEITQEFVNKVIRECKENPDVEMTGRVDGVYWVGRYHSDDEQIGIHINLRDLKKKEKLK